MKWNKSVISLMMLLAPIWVMEVRPFAIGHEPEVYGEPEEQNRYDIRVSLYKRHWAQLIPRQVVIQNAGNMGALSLGIGWDYGHQRWETHLLFGYIPKHDTTRGKLTMTVKENFIPWSIGLNKENAKKGMLSLEPMTASIYLNTVYGHEFWKSQPSRYPNGYYDFMSTKFRLNVALGQRLTWHIPKQKRRGSNSISLFYEVSSCDLYIRSKAIDHNVSWKDILGLSIGLKLQRL